MDNIKDMKIKELHHITTKTEFLMIF